MVRGDLIRRVITATEILKVSDEETEKTYKRQIVNMQGNAVGSMNAFIKKVGGSIIGIDNSLRSIAEKIDSKNPNKELRKAVEELNNLEKLIK